MGAARPILGFISLIVLAAGILFQFFIILSGAVNSTPENLIYFLEADTSGIGNAPINPARWTYFSLCGADENGHNANCGSPRAAFPFNPVQNFGTTEGLPEQFIRSASRSTNKFFLLSRFAWVFYLISLFFAVLGLLTGLLALCSRLGSYITAGNALLAFFFQAVAASLMTAWVVLGRNAFQSAGHDARIGRYAMGFTWASVAAFLINVVLSCIGGAAGGNDGSSYRAPKKGFFGVGRKQSTRSRGSLRNSRVKDDYS